MTSDALFQIGIPIDDTLENRIMVGAAFEWILNNTLLDFDINDVETIKALPSSAKLFVLKYIDIMSTNVSISSESLGGMSQSFQADKTNLLWSCAQDLLGTYLKSSCSFVSCAEKWGVSNGCKVQNR